ncbi:unnamed protein product [Closterium sp. NIES-65]|nr:unnamed protein product [Closterium sp. NIES-65]
MTGGRAGMEMPPHGEMERSGPGAHRRRVDAGLHGRMRRGRPAAARVPLRRWRRKPEVVRRELVICPFLFLPYFQEAHVAAALITVQSQFLELPLYANSPQAYYVLKGEAMAGLISPMGAPTNLRRLREGDAFAIPRGWARWIWNNGQQPFQVLSVADTSHAANTSKGAPSAAGRYTAFHLMGAHKENFGSILHGFSHDLMAQAWDVEEGEVQQLLQAQQESVFVKVTPQLRAELENYGEEDEEENENEKETENGNENGNEEEEEEAEEAEENEREEEEAYGGNDQPQFGKGAKPGVSIFADFSYNLKARQPDIYVKRGGTVTAANGYKLPAFRKVGFAVARFSLEGNAMTAPAWLANAAAMVYVTKGKGRVEMVYLDGRQALRHDVKEGDLVVMPAGFPHSALAYGEGLECIAMIPKSRFQQGFLAGTNSVWRTLPASVQRAAFNADEKLLEKLRATRQSEFGILPPRKSKGEEEGEEIVCAH